MKRFIAEIFQDVYDAFSSKRLIGIVGFACLIGMFIGGWFGATFPDALINTFGGIVTTALIAIAGEQFNWTRWRGLRSDHNQTDP